MNHQVSLNTIALSSSNSNPLVKTLSIGVLASCLAISSAKADDLAGGIARKIENCTSAPSQWMELLQLAKFQNQKSCDRELLAKELYEKLDIHALAERKTDDAFRRELNEAMIAFDDIRTPKKASITASPAYHTANQEADTKIQTAPGYFSSDE